VKPRLSLKGKGVQLLSQRDHSRVELRRKLLAHARKTQELQKLQELSKEQLPLQSQADGADPASSASAVAVAFSVEAAAPVDPGQQVDEVLDWLQMQRYLDEGRFIESRTHARAGRFGNQRIRQELARHGLSLSPDAAQRLRDTELSRAKEVWQRKFGVAAADAAGRARQMRFLAARGFSGDVIQRVVRGLDED
jgi:regulatory protein